MSRLINDMIRRPRASCGVMICLICAFDRSIAFAESHAVSGTGALTDFVSFWASSRLLIEGANPFSPVEVLKMQRAVGLNEANPLLIWHPPWTLSFLLPFGAMPFQISQFCWLLINVFFILFSAQTLWSIYCKTPTNAYWSWIAAFTLIPTWMVLLIGQMSPLVLLGIVGFMHFEKNRQHYLAGISTVIISVKPHLFYLFWVGLILWFWKERRWRVACGAVAAGAIVAIIPLIIDPKVYQQFIDMYLSPGQATPFNLPAPSIGSLLTRYVPHGNLPIQFLPPLLGSLWFLWHWHKHKEHWNWSEQIPLMILVSLTLSPYSWTYDQVILLPAVMHGLEMVSWRNISWYKSGLGLLYFGANGCYFVGKVLVTTDSYYFWLAPVFLLIYLGVSTSSRRTISAMPPKAT
jgi:glycosyl transferase family 87